MDEIKTKKELDDDVLSIQCLVSNLVPEVKSCPELNKAEKEKITKAIEGEGGVMDGLSCVWAITNSDYE